MKRPLALAFALSLSLGLFAQHNEEVTIEGTYRPKVNKVDKILLQPETPKPSFDLPDTEVRVLDIEHRFPLELEKLSALNYNSKNVQSHEVAKNFLMAGFGSRISPLFLYKHHSNLNKNLELGVGIKHYSSWLEMKHYAPSGYMNNAFDIHLASNKFDDLLVDGGVYYKYDMVHYYGLNLDTWSYGSNLVSSMAPQQNYNTIGATFGLASTNTRNGAFVHDLDLDYHYLFDKVFSGQEHDGRLDYDLGFVENWWGKKDCPQKLGLSLGAQYGKTFYGTLSDDRMIFKVNPYLEMKDEFYRLHLGVRLDGSVFETKGKLLTVHPDIKGSLLVLDNQLEFYAGLTGGRKMCTYSDLINENPFVRAQKELKVTTVKLGFEGGIRAHVMPSMDVHVGVRYRDTHNDCFYKQKVNLTSAAVPYNSFDLVYDETRSVTVLADVRWLALDKLTVDAGLAYHQYWMSHEDHPWYRPTTEGNLKLSYRLDEQWDFNASLLYQGGRYAQSFTSGGGVAVKMKDVIDLGLGADYRVNEELSVFVKGKNLLHQKYQIFFDYPVSGIELFAGIKMSF